MFPPVSRHSTGFPTIGTVVKIRLVDQFPKLYPLFVTRNSIIDIGRQVIVFIDGRAIERAEAKFFDRANLCSYHAEPAE